MNSVNTEIQTAPNRSKTRSPTKGGNSHSIQEEPKADDDASMSDDVELNDMSEEDGLQDDEETGLTGKDRGKRKQRKRRNTLLDQRIASSVEISAEEKKEADQNVIKRSLVNGLLIGLWYVFSLSISIVSCPPVLPSHLLIFCSTTNGCSIPSTSTSTSPCSQRVCTCWSNSHFPPSSSSFSLNFDHDTTPYPIPTTHMQMESLCSTRKIPRNPS